MKQMTIRKKVSSFLSVFLAMSVLVSGNGLTVIAQTISGNEIQMETADELAETEGIEKAQSVETDNTRRNPANPVYDSVSHNAVWDYVYFGSYPQSQVTDANTIAAIEDAIAKANSGSQLIGGKPSDVGIDVWVDGIKYRRITKDDSPIWRGSTDDFWGDVEYRYFKWDRIKWKVLQNNGDTLFVISDKALDSQSYYGDDFDVDIPYQGWENSNIRRWLNNDFMNCAFTSDESASIETQRVTNNDFNSDNVGATCDTYDKVYLLSYILGETCNLDYGYEATESYDDDTVTRVVPSTEYCQYYGGSYADGGNGKPIIWWLTRDGAEGRAYYIRTDGSHEWWWAIGSLGVVPALHINIESDFWYTEDDGTSGDGGEGDTFISLEASKGKTVYTQGDSLNLDDLKVSASYSDNWWCVQEEMDVRHTEISSDAYTTNVATLDMNTPGKKTLTISYTDNGITKTVDVMITVNVKETEVPEQEETQDKPSTETNTEGIQSKPSTETNKEETQNNSSTEVKKVKKLTVHSAFKKVAVGTKVPLTITVKPADATNPAVKWTSSNKKYATVDKNGHVTLKKAGAGKKVTITATSTDGSNKKSSIKLQITKEAVQRVRIVTTTRTVKVGKSIVLKAVVNTTGKNANKVVKWESSNPKYATVSTNGKVKAKKAGKGKTVTITATSTDGTNKKAKVKIKIK